MATCPSCGREVTGDKRFCGDCGSAVDSNAAAAATATSFEAHRRPVSSLDSADQARFLPGAMLAGRYRIVGLLGRGGMGEVYRADDVKLGQPVALKFLPRGLQDDPSRLERFLNEVKLARQVSHPNVCRVYDLVEAEGQHFLSMEYVDGEDLSSLLRRIGRLPGDKAVQLARQLCAGLAAAHEQQILHRDLKPANVMIDGRGRAKITDFGLASLEGVGREDVRAGTPAYMAPEQLAGREVTVRSDLYALGLVLYELFTGKAVYSGGSVADITRQQQESTPTSPSSHVEGFDTAVERVILQCLDKHPEQRPRSALAVAAALPGGDPLAAALAAGETPSPEMVANAGGQGLLRPAIAIACLVVIVAGIALLAFFNGKYSLLARTPTDKPPQALADRALEITQRFGLEEKPVDSAYGFATNGGRLEHIRETDDSPERWDQLATTRPTGILFWYRRSPRPMKPQGGSGQVRIWDPRQDVTDMAIVELDALGHLEWYFAIPPQKDDSQEPFDEFDWSLLFVEAGLDFDTFTEATPTWIPAAYCDTRRAWTGAYPDQLTSEIHLEACTYRGKLVSFDIQHPWSRATRQDVHEPTTGEKAATVFSSILFGSFLIGAALLARYNLRLGRGDRQSARRLAFVIILALQLEWICKASHLVTFSDELDLWFHSVAWSLFSGGFAWLIYIAVEPFVRRRWPEALASWTRLLSGRFRDPLIGTHVLVGAALGVTISVANQLSLLVPGWLGKAAPTPSGIELTKLNGARWVAGELFWNVQGHIQGPVSVFVLLVLLGIVLRKRWLAAPALIVLMTVGSSLGADHFLSTLIINLLIFGVLVIAMTRLGILAAISFFYFYVLPHYYPLTLDFSSWYAGASIVPILVAIALAGYAFYTSQGGRPLIQEAPEGQPARAA